MAKLLVSSECKSCETVKCLMLLGENTAGEVDTETWSLSDTSPGLLTSDGILVAVVVHITLPLDEDSGSWVESKRSLNVRRRRCGVYVPAEKAGRRTLAGERVGASGADPCLHNDTLHNICRGQSKDMRR